LTSLPRASAVIIGAGIVGNSTRSARMADRDWVTCMAWSVPRVATTTSESDRPNAEPPNIERLNIERPSLERGFGIV